MQISKHLHTVEYIYRRCEQLYVRGLLWVSHLFVCVCGLTRVFQFVHVFALSCLMCLHSPVCLSASAC